MSRLPETITVRPASADDASALIRLAALDSAPLPPAPLVVAEVDGELRAALSLANGRSIADPFHLSLALVDLLRLHAAAMAPALGVSAHRRPRATAAALRFA